MSRLLGLSRLLGSFDSLFFFVAVAYNRDACIVHFCALRGQPAMPRSSEESESDIIVDDASKADQMRARRSLLLPWQGLFSLRERQKVA